jgi:two-component system, OmpR family, alkaline phosphatase synthesis response regulator PhoP
MNKRVLIVEDDPEIISLLKENLKYEDFDLSFASDGNTGLEKARRKDHGVIILDWMLPEVSGIDVVKMMRKENIQTPVIMLTARHAEMDKIEGLESGCDDYITKPFNMRELIARINAVMRRNARRQHDDNGDMPLITVGDLSIDQNSRKVFLKGEELQLTATEFNLITLLARQPGRVYSRKQLLDLIWDYSYAGYENTVNTHVNRLRSKIEENPNKPTYVITVWGVGYKFSDEL